jgi:excisionase family DNA binding protein
MTDEPLRPLRFLTIEQVAQELNVGEPLIRAMLKSGELRGMQIGGRGVWRIGIADLDAYIEAAYQRTAERISQDNIAEAQHPSNKPLTARCVARRACPCLLVERKSSALVDLKSVTLHDALRMSCSGG